MSKKVIALAVDHETTGFDKVGGDIIATGMVEILEDYTLGREVVFYSKPVSTKYWGAEAEEIHGISYFKAMTFPTRRENIMAMMEWLTPLMDQFPLKMVYHANGLFDFDWLKMHFIKEDLEKSFYRAFSIDLAESTVKLTRDNITHLTKVNTKGKTIKSAALDVVSKYYEIELIHHDPLSDARACAQIWCNIKQGIGLWSGELAL